MSDGGSLITAAPLRGAAIGARRRAVRALDRLGLKPQAQRVALRFGYLADTHTRARNRRRRVVGAPDGLPLPEPGDVQVITGRSYDVQAYLETGAESASSMREILARNDEDLVRCSPILDFGCGVARVLRHLPLGDVELYGADFNPRMLAWCQENIQEAQFELCSANPPLPYRSGQFGLAYAVGVFTSFNAGQQLAWRDEMARVLRPGGLLYITLQSEGYLRARGDRGHANADNLSPPERAELASGGLVVHGERYGPDDTRPDHYVACQAIHSEQYVRSTLAAGFELVDIVPSGARDSQHDVALLRKPR